MSFLDFNNQEKGYKSLYPDRANFRDNIGKTICYVTERDVDRNRGYVFTRYAKIHGTYRNRLLIDEGNDSIRIGDILQCGVKIEQ